MGKDVDQTRPGQPGELLNRRSLFTEAAMQRVAPLLVFFLLLPLLLWSQTEQKNFDVLIINGTVYDGTGGDPIQADVGIKDDRIVAIGKLDIDQAVSVVDVNGLAVAPGFINMLSWAVGSLITDGRSQSDIRQGVTTEIFGEGFSMGPLNNEMKRRAVSAQSDIKYDINWTTLAEYLTYLEKARDLAKRSLVHRRRDDSRARSRARRCAAYA